MTSVPACLTAIVDKVLVSITTYPHNSLAASASWLQSHGLNMNEPVRVTNVETGALAFLRIVMVEDVELGCVRLSKRMRSALGLVPGDELTIAPESVLTYDNMALQAASTTGSSVVQIPTADLVSLDRSCTYQRLICRGSGNELIVKTEDFEGFSADDGKSGTIKLDRHQRKLLGLEVPLELRPEELALYLKKASEIDREFIRESYPNGLLAEGLSFAEKRRLYAALCEGDFEQIYVTGLHQEAAGTNGKVCRSANTRPVKDSRGPGQALCDFFLRASSMTLMCVRPYDLDEGRDVVRISPDTMALLGVDEGDSVRVRYGSLERRARVLSLENENAIMQTNLLDSDTSFDNIVGIPASLRYNLNINSLRTSVVIERDTKFLFKKHLNIQFFSIIAMLFTIWQTVEVFDIDPLHATIAFFVLLPFVLYLILSEERMRVQKLE